MHMYTLTSCSRSEIRSVECPASMTRGYVHLYAHLYELHHTSGHCLSYVGPAMLCADSQCHLVMFWLNLVYYGTLTDLVTIHAGLIHVVVCISV